MKKGIIIVLSLICVFVCSCKKEPQDLLIGTWQLVKTERTAEWVGNPTSKTYEPLTETFMVFNGDGTGRTFTKDNNRSFSYVFNDASSSLILMFENGGTTCSVEELTKNSLVLLSTNNTTLLGAAATFTEKAYYTKVQ